MKILKLTKGGLSVLWYAIHDDCNRVVDGRLAPKVPIAGAMGGRTFNRMMDAISAHFENGEPPSVAVGPGRVAWTFVFEEDSERDVSFGNEEYALLKMFWDTLTRNSLVGAKPMRDLIESVDCAFDTVTDYKKG